VTTPQLERRYNAPGWTRRYRLANAQTR
jgi:hypothetical protein